jgi:uncharacterized membrane-anchored protein
VLYYCTVHNQRIAAGLDIKVSQLREENAQVAAERDRLTEEKTKWLETQQTMKEEKAKLAKVLNSYQHNTLQL